MRWRALVRVAPAASVAGLLWWLAKPVAALAVAAFGLLVLVLGLVSPALLVRAERVLVLAVGTVLSWVLLAPVFYLVITPFGLLARRGPRDRMGRRRSSAETYWRERDRASSLERPY